VKRLLVASIALALGAAALAEEKVTFDPKRLSDEVKALSADDFQGRGPATPGEEKTVAWISQQFEEAGLEPGGDLVGGKRGWTQAVPLLRAEIQGTPSLTLKVAGQEQALVQGEHIAVRAALDGSTSVEIEDAPLVFAGYGVKAPERGWDDFKGIDVKGKVLVVLINDPDFETGEGAFGGKAMTYYGRWTYKYEEAARLGAAGLLIVHETDPASYGWNTVKNSNTNTMFDVVRDKPSSVHSKMEGWIQRDVAVDLLQRAGLDFEALKRQAQTKDFKPVELKDVTFSAKYAVKSEQIVSKNVAGRVVGTKRPDEHVVYSGHWDHLGVGLPDAEGDTIYNGAVDNATGIAAIVELARAFANGPKPDRSILFLAVTAEEKGLLGSEYYASKPLFPLAKTVAVINLDALDPTGPAKNFTTSGSAKQELLDELIAKGRQWGLAYAEDPHPEAGYFFRSDHFPFAKRGVPSVSFGSGNDWVQGGTAAGEAAGKVYTEKRYHQPADEWEESWPFTGLARDLEFLFALGNDLANSTRWPNWDKSSEFRAARDATAKERK
jgi:Zn-dependent M28 family amino/carboxypeptidase